MLNTGTWLRDAVNVHSRLVANDDGAWRKRRVKARSLACRTVSSSRIDLDDYLSTYGDTREAALESTREAIVGYLEAATKDGIPLPRSGPEPSIVELEVALP